MSDEHREARSRPLSAGEVDVLVRRARRAHAEAVDAHDRAHLLQDQVARRRQVARERRPLGS